MLECETDPLLTIDVSNTQFVAIKAIQELIKLNKAQAAAFRCEDQQITGLESKFKNLANKFASIKQGYSEVKA